MRDMFIILTLIPYLCLASPSFSEVECDDVVLHLDLKEVHDFIPQHLKGLRLQVFEGSLVEFDDSHVRLTVADRIDGYIRKGSDFYLVSAESKNSKLSCVRESHDADKHNCPHSDSNSHFPTPHPEEIDAIKRRSPQSPNHVVCDVFLDADTRFLAEWGGSCRPEETMNDCLVRRQDNTIRRMIQIIYLVDGIYSDPKNFGGQTIRFSVAGARLHSDTFGIPTGVPGQSISPSIVLDTYQRWLGRNERGSSHVNANQVCLNHLFTHNNLGSTLGQASYLIAPDNRIESPICSTRYFSGSAYNAGFSNTQFQGGSAASLWTTVLTAAHEIGHNLGSPHDCCSASDTLCTAGGTRPLCTSTAGHQCWPTPEQGGQYIMYPQITNSLSAANAKVFSPCTKASVQTAVSNSGSCLKTVDPCRNGGECCFNGQLKPAGTVCRAADPFEPCYGVGKCTGDHPFCPENEMLEDGTFCDTDLNPNTEGTHAVCHAGSCSNIHQGFCQSELSLFGCTIPNHECIRACFSSNQGCRQYARACNIVDDDNFIRFWRTPETCPLAPVNTPCVLNGQDGKCNSEGACIACPDSGCGFEAPTFAPLCEWQLETSYSQCSQTCGGGTKRKNYVCKCNGDDAPETSCTLEKPAAVIQSCNTNPCPRDCFCGDWSEWTSCSTTCDGGTTTRSRSCTEAVAGGQSCASLSLDSSVSKGCNIGPCPSLCDLRASPCDETPCFTNTRCEDGQCVSDALPNGSECRLSDGSEGHCQIGACSPLPQNCEVSEWTVWSSCSDTCVRSRSRDVTVQPENGGIECPVLDDQDGCCGIEISVSGSLDSASRIDFQQVLLQLISEDIVIVWLTPEPSRRRQNDDVTKAVVSSPTLEASDLLLSIEENQDSIQQSVSVQFTAVDSAETDGLQETTTAAPSSGSNGGAIAGGVIGTLIILVIVVGGFIWFRQRGSSSVSSTKHVEHHSSKLSDTPTVIVPPHSRAKAQPVHKPHPIIDSNRVRVIQDYQSDAEYHLQLKMGDVVTIIKRHNEDWIEGSLNGQKGYFPASHVTEITSSAPPSKPPAPSRPHPQRSHAHPSRPKGPPRPHAPTKPVVSSDSNHNTPQPHVPKIQHPILKVRALYDYSARNDTELSFKENDTIDVMSRETDFDGWWMGRFRGRQGLVPSNYLETRHASIVLSDMPKSPIYDKISSQVPSSQQQALQHVPSTSANKPERPQKPQKPSRPKPTATAKPAVSVKPSSLRPTPPAKPAKPAKPPLKPSRPARPPQATNKPIPKPKPKPSGRS